MDIFTFTKSHVDNLKYRELDSLAERSGVPVHTINKIKSGETKNPGVLTVQKLFDAIVGKSLKQ